MAVACARAVARHHARPLQDREVLAAADAWERIFHGNPSGVDAAAAYFGGCLRYERTSGASPLPLASSLTLLVAVAGPPSATKLMVERVAGFRERDLPAFTSHLAAIAKLTELMQRCVLTADVHALGSALSQNHELLAGWGLSTPELERCREVARRAGALGSKLTGAGGGGCVVAVAVPGAEAAVLQAWQDAGFRAFRALVSPRGVQ
jgi:mevalonate kinase